MMRIIISCFLTLFSASIFAMASKLHVNTAIDKAVLKYGLRTEPELKRFFAKANVAYPPKKIALLTFKKEMKVELWAKNEEKTWHYIHSYPMTASSGRLGPKLRESDGQIPEGLYRLVTFNPFSSMHLSMMIDYPNHFDKLQASKDGRDKLGNNIFLHGKSQSVGCVAVGDRAIDQLFLLARRVGLNQIQLIIAPNDLRLNKPETTNFAQPRWLPELYQQISAALLEFPKQNMI